MIELCVGKESGSEDTSAGMLLVLPPTFLNAARANQSASGVSRALRTTVVSGELPKPTQVWNYVAELTEQLEKLDFKRLTVLGIGRGSEIAQALAIESPKLIRRVILVDAMTREYPSAFSKVVDRLEQFLPLGLPLRKLSRSFDSRPLLHRLRCPTLVITSALAGQFEVAQAKLLAEKIPNAWNIQIKGLPFDAAWQLNRSLVKEILAFVQVPTKRPQKNRVANGAS